MLTCFTEFTGVADSNTYSFTVVAALARLAAEAGAIIRATIDVSLIRGTSIHRRTRRVFEGITTIVTHGWKPCEVLIL